jgi:hypothetical protein
MKIREPIKELPITAMRKSRYGAIWAAVVAGAGDWVPVECDSAKARTNLQCSAAGLWRWGKRPRMQSVSDVASFTVYIRTVDGTKP